MSDFIDEFMKQTIGIRAPDSFRLWTAITTLSGVTERRVFTHTDRGKLYPNLYTILSGAPASGKGLCIAKARDLWAGISGLHLGPDNPTKASFLDCLEAAIGSGAGMNGTIYCAMSVACREFGVLIPKHDPAFLSDLTDLWDSPTIYVAPRRSTKSVTINKPVINILAAITPDFLHDIMPESAWGQGFTSRLLFIYGASVPDTDRDVLAKHTEANLSALAAKLKEIFTELHGECTWSDDAHSALNTWVRGGMEPVPQYGRLTHYVGRRAAYVCKLAMISSISAENGLRVQLDDFERAKRWLLEAEALMPDVFRAMAQKSDAQLIRDLHFHIYTLWSRVSRDKREPVKDKIIWEWIAERVPSERVSKVFESAIRSGYLIRSTYPNEFIPRTLDKTTET